MKVILRSISRKFGSQTIFQNINYTFEEGHTYVLLGGNGSGKSTLLKIIYTALSPSSGKLEHYRKSKKLKIEEIPFKISIAAPYLEMIEELTALEFLDYYRKFKIFSHHYSVFLILDIAELKDAAHKKIKNFSYGMKQKLRLVIALLSSSELILLDEPISNLDQDGVQWYRQLLKDYLNNRTLIISSNFNEEEMGSCQNFCKLADYK